MKIILVSLFVALLALACQADQQCPDGSACPDGNTCCAMGGGQYGCCPYPSATCCSDDEHCCPNGYTCDLSSQTCNKQFFQPIPFAKKQKATVRDNCPDGSYCPSGNTCCPRGGGQYGCCPSGSKCLVDHGGQCLQGKTGGFSAIIPFEKKQPSLKDDQCPDGSYCPSGNTCCAMGGGQYGCCPYDNAVCCSDDQHCCPSGYQCDVAHGQCLQGKAKGFAAIIPFQKKQPSLKDDQCPDGSDCPDGSTCCAMSGGQYGCCPYPSATCCNDGEHCCPNGYTCDVAHGQCLQSKLKFFQSKSLAKINKPMKKIIKDVQCPDGSSCDDDNTCCQGPAGLGYGCCPMPDATCCSDGLHCCPGGSTCNLSAGTCDSAGLMKNLNPLLIPLLSKKMN